MAFVTVSDLLTHSNEKQLGFKIYYNLMPLIVFMAYLKVASLQLQNDRSLCGDFQLYVYFMDTVRNSAPPRISLLLEFYSPFVVENGFRLGEVSASPFVCMFICPTLGINTYR